MIHPTPRRQAPSRLAGTLIIGLALLGALIMALGALGAVPATQAAPAAELHVCASGCAYSSLQAAIHDASPNDTIKVAAGVYTDVHELYILGNPSFPARQVVYLTKTLTIAGGYTLTNWITPDLAANPTILDAEGQGRVVQAWDDSGGTITVTLRGLRLTGGDTSAGGSFNSTTGGGVYANNAHLIVENCQVHGNQALVPSGAGGGIYAMQGSLSLVDSEVSENHVTLNGGGLYLASAPLTLTSGQIISNSAQNHGGGVFADQAAATVHAADSLLHGNYSRFAGGALYLNGAGGALVGTRFSDNAAGGFGSSHGGALYSNLASALEIDGGHFTGNHAAGRGGALAIENAEAVTITRSLLQDNDAVLEGGGLLARNSNLAMASVAVVDNSSALEGAGLWLESSDATLQHLTIARNSSGDGAGLHVTHIWDNSRFSDVSMINSIVAGQALGVYLDIGDAASLNTVMWDGNTVNTSGSIAVSNNRSGQADFAPDGYHIMSNSNAIEQGNPNYTPLATEDIDSEPRQLRSGYDIGADEYPFWPRQYLLTFDELHPGDTVNFSLNVQNYAPLTYTLAVTDLVPSCLIPQGPTTWTATLMPNSSWLSGVLSFEIAPGSDGPCTNTVVFTTLEGAHGSLATAIDVVGSVSTTVSPAEGGSLVYQEGGSPVVEIAVPAGAVTDTTVLAYTPAAAPAGAPGTLQFAGTAFDLSAFRDDLLLPGFTFETGITVTLHYTDADIVGLDETALELAYWDGAAWATAGITLVGQDLDANSVSFWVTHLTDFALFAPPAANDYRLFLPLVKRP